MENGEPQIGSIEVSRSGTDVEITADVEHTRNCADCGTELKSISISFSESLSLKDVGKPDEMSETDFEKWRAGLKKAEVEIDEDGSDSDESGGGRYAKNMIGVVVDYTLKITSSKIELKKSGQLREENPASAYDECC
jgi:hypothetical protein